MSRKNSLPDSLELLLDTMCNTFGGIMFIAISLVVISQLMSAAMRKMTPERIDETQMAELRSRTETMRQEVLSLQRQAMELQFRLPPDASPEQKATVRELIRLKNANLRKREELDRLAAESDTVKTRSGRLWQESETLKNELRIRTAALQANLAESSREILENEKRIEQLEALLEQQKSRTLRFSMEKPVSRPPYWIVLKDDMVYRLGFDRNPFPGEVAQENFDSGRKVRFIPLKGTSPGENPRQVFDILFQQLSPENCFVSIALDSNSFSALLHLRQFFREKEISVYWRVNPNFEFAYSSDVVYKASE